MDYSDFIEHLITFLWKAGDAQLEKSLPSLINMANAELNRKLLIPERETSALLTVTAEDTPMPADYYSFRDLTSTNYGPNVGEWKYVTPAELLTQRAAFSYTGANAWSSVYSLRGTDTLMLVGNFSASAPATLSLTYQTRVPTLSSEGSSSWLTEFYLDLYTYAVLKHTAPFLREDERVQLWASLYQDCLMSALEVAEYNRVSGKSARQPLPRQASSVSQGGYYSRR